MPAEPSCEHHVIDWHCPLLTTCADGMPLLRHRLCTLAQAVQEREDMGEHQLTAHVGLRMIEPRQ